LVVHGTEPHRRTAATPRRSGFIGGEPDQLYGRFPAADAIPLIGQLQMIEVCGPGRLVANKEWERLNAER